MKRSGYIKRSTTPIRKRKYRKGEETIGKTGRIRLRGKKLEQLRRDCYERDGGQCVWEGCGKPLLWESGSFNSMHMAHIVSRGAGGSDVISNVRSLCAFHHIGIEHSKGKSAE
jgi:5-methylcytosine-specific restriction endonuclease McrA